MDTTIFDPIAFIETVIERGDESAWATILNTALELRHVPRSSYFLGRLALLALRLGDNRVPDFAQHLESSVEQVQAWIAEAQRYELQVDEELQALIPPMQAEQRRRLEVSILTEGWRENEKIITWHGTIIDGHNRYDICRRHHIAFETLERDFADRESVKVWMLDNQLARRNLSDYLYGKLALRRREIIETRAKANLAWRSDPLSNLTKREPVDTRDELARIAGVSNGTMAKVMFIDQHAPPLIQQAAEAEAISVDRAYQLTRALETVKKQNARYYAEIVESGCVTNLDGESQPLLEADPTLLRVMSIEDEYERAKRQAAYIDDYRWRRVMAGKEPSLKLGDWKLTFQLTGAQLTTELAPDIAQALGGDGEREFRIVLYRVEEDADAAV